MIPTTPILETSIQDVEYQNRTYRIVIDSNRISGYCDGTDAVIQAIYLILGTERYVFPIYSWDYGIELNSLFGKQMPFVIAEIPVRVRDALLVDNRISDVTDFVFDRNGKQLHVQFTVVTNVGTIPTEMEVEV